MTLTEELKARKQCAWEHILVWILYTTHIKRGEMFINYFFPDSKIQILSYYSFVKPKQPTPLQLFRSNFKGNKHLGLVPQKSQHRLKNKVLVFTHHLLTHARFTIWISIDLSIVLYDWETGWQRSNLFFTLIWTGAAAGVLTTTIITVKHPEWIASFPFCSWSMFCLKIN